MVEGGDVVNREDLGGSDVAEHGDLGGDGEREGSRASARNLLAERRRFSHLSVLS